MIEISEKTEEIYQLFTPTEGFNTVYYGKIGNGKTRNATADILELLSKGETVYANWMIKVPDYDERSILEVVWRKFLRKEKYFFKFGQDNFHYFDPQDLIDNKGAVNMEFLSRLVGVHIFIDEGQWILNSMDKYDPKDPLMVAKLKLVLHGRHYCRSLNVITQRPSNINKNVRSQVSIWYRCVKKFDMWGFMVFQRWAIQDMKDDLPVEFIIKHDKEGKVIRDVPNGDRKLYFVNVRNDKVFSSYNTHAMRDKDAIEPDVKFNVFYSTGRQRLFLLLSLVFPSVATLMRATAERFRKLGKGRIIKKDVVEVKNERFKVLSDVKRKVL